MVPQMPLNTDLADEEIEKTIAEPTEALLVGLDRRQAVPLDTSSYAPPELQPANQLVDVPAEIVTPSKRGRRRPSASPPPTLEYTRLRPRVTPSKLYGSALVDSANARRPQPPKSPCPSPPVPSQIRSKAAAANSPPVDSNTGNVPAPDGTSHPQLMSNVFGYNTGYPHPPPGQRMASPYASSFPGGFPPGPMNAAQYGPGVYEHYAPYSDYSHYGPPPGTHYRDGSGSRVGPPFAYPQSSAYPYSVPQGEKPYLIPHPNESGEPYIPTPNTNTSITRAGSYPALPRPLSRAPDSRPLSRAPDSRPLSLAPEQSPRLNPANLPRLPDAVPPDSSSSEGATGKLKAPGAPDSQPVVFYDKDFVQIPLPPPPNVAPNITVSPPTDSPPTPTPLVSVTPVKPLVPPTEGAGDDQVSNYRRLLDFESPTVGRLSRMNQEALITGLEKLDKLVADVASSSGLSIIQVKERWGRARSTRKLSLWNIYQSYIKHYREQEIGRLISVKKSKSMFAHLYLIIPLSLLRF